MLLNRDRAAGVMADLGIDALLGTTPINLTYLSDYSPWHHWVYRLYTPQHYMFQNYALVPRDRSTPPALIFGHPIYQAQWPSWIEDLYPFGRPSDMDQEIPAEGYPPEVQRYAKLRDLFLTKASKTAGEALVKALRDRGLTRGVVGADLEGMQPAQLEHVRRELPDVQIKEAGEVLRYIRMVKTPDELARLRKAAEINEQGMRELLKAAVPGNTELDLLAAHRAGVGKAGGMPLFCNNACGPRALAHFEPSGYVLKPGDSVYCDAGCTYQYYNADTNVCGVIGEPNRRQREIFDALDEGIAAGTAAARPGVKVSEVIAAIQKAATRSGALPASTAFGHAIGLEARDMPFIQAPYPLARDDILNISTDLPLEAGMVINLEEAKRELGVGSLAVEHSIVVTPTGCELLIPQPRQLEVLPV